MTPYAYTEKVVTSDLDFLDALARVRVIAHHGRNLIRENEGADILDGVEGWYVAPSQAEQIRHQDVLNTDLAWEHTDHLLPYVQVAFKAPHARSPVRFTYEIRQVFHGRLMKLRVLSMQMDVITASTQPLMPSEVMSRQAEFYALAESFVRLFMPLHDGVGATIHAGDPVPRHFPGEETFHARTPILMRFSADADDHHNEVMRTAAAPSEQGSRPRTRLFGPDDKLIH